MPRRVVFDDDNPEWTSKDFREARPAYEMLPPEVLDAFPNTPRGPQQQPAKAAVSIRLSREVLDHLRASGPGWQSRIDETLKEAIKAGRL